MHITEIKELEEKLKKAKELENQICDYSSLIGILRQQNYVTGLKLKILYGSSAETERELEVEDKVVIIPVLEKRLEALRLKFESL